jgi:hypothetical protein
MAVEIERLSPQCSAPSAPGTVIVLEAGPGHAEVRFMQKDGPVGGAVIYTSSLGRGDDFEQAVEWALKWSANRGISKIYVEAELPAEPSDRPIQTTPS